MANETRKSFQHRFTRGDFEAYFKGRGLDIGAGDDPLSAPYASVETWDKAQGDAQYLRKRKAQTYDFVYSSHCLEHMKDVRIALINWCRVLKPGGYLYVVVPDFHLYEKEIWPSGKNLDHKHSFSTKLTQKEAGRPTHWSVYTDLEPILSQMNVMLEFVELEDHGYDYSITDIHVDQTHEGALCQICFIGRKIG
jgi:SAM-dependent methyltransferase